MWGENVSRYILIFLINLIIFGAINFFVFFKIYKPVKASLKTKAVCGILNGLLSESESTAAVSRHKISVLSKKFRVSAVEISAIKTLQMTQEDVEIHQIRYGIIDEITAEFTEKCDCLAVEMNSFRIAVIVDITDETEFSDLLKEALRKCEKKFGFPLVGAVGPLCETAVFAKNSYDAAAEILDGSAGFSETPVVSKGVYDAAAYYYPLEREKNIILNITRRNYEDARAEITEILVENFTRRKLSPETMNTFLLAIVNTLNRVLHAIKAKPEEVFGNDVVPYLEMKMAKTDKELSAKVNNLFDGIIIFLEKSAKNRDSGMCEMLRKFIHENYQNDISLADISDKFKISRSYVSTQFKDSTGQNFKDYLNMYRIKKAKDVLSENPKFLIKDLAKLVGYNSVNSFIRIFNKYEGMTPGQFVKKN